MALLEIKRDPTNREVRQFSCYWLPAFCALVALWIWLRWDAGLWALAPLIAGALSVLVGLLRPEGMRLVFLGWMWAAFPLGWLVSHLLLAAIYYLVLTPIGLIMRVLGRDPLARRFEPKATTYWTPHAPPRDPAQYFRQF